MAQPHRNLVKAVFHCRLPADSGSHDSQRRSQRTRERGNGSPSWHDGRRRHGFEELREGGSEDRFGWAWLALGLGGVDQGGIDPEFKKLARVQAVEPKRILRCFGDGCLRHESDDFRTRNGYTLSDGLSFDGL